MPKLLKNIESNFIDIIKQDLLFVNKLEVKIGMGDFFELNSLIVFNQNYGFVVSLFDNNGIKSLGFKNEYIRKNLKISY